jgi:uroporphyrinogen III methyltransferase/synthase
VGAGPWNPELLTIGGRDRLSRADVVICDYLVNPALLLHCRADALLIQRVRGDQKGLHLGQSEINDLLVEHALAGKYVVRLKGGDPMVFGRGPEEASVLREKGIAFEFVPGVSAAIAAPEAAGIPVTHRDHTPAVSFVSGFEAYEKRGLHVDWEKLAGSEGTLVLMMSVRNCRRNAGKLVAAGRSAATPAAVVRWGTRGIQRTVVGTLEDIADRVEAAGIRAPAVMVVGDVVGEREQTQWFEHKPLFGKRVIVTRAPEQSADLVRRFAESGADVVCIPSIATRPPEDEEQLRETVGKLEGWQGVILSSANGVDALVDAIMRESDLRCLAHAKILTIGRSTQLHALARGLRADLRPTQAHSEGVVEALRTAGALTERWLHVRADEGRPVIGQAFDSAGGSLTTVVGYRVVRPPVPELLLRSLLPAKEGGEGFDAVCFASGRTARNFVDHLAECLGEVPARVLLESARVVAIGPVTADAIRTLGLHVDAVASEASDAGMYEATVELL